MNRRRVYVFILGLVCMASVAQAATWDRAVYWDSRYSTGWADNASSIAVRDGCVAAGYTLLDADQLKTWMDGHIADGALSVVVFGRDIFPNTVVETVDPNCTLRKYLNAGGKIVFYADIPFYNIAIVNNALLTPNPATGGGNAVLGIAVAGAPWDTYNTVKITADGAAWGLTTTWASQRATLAAQVDRVLATDNAGNAAAWVKHFVPGDTYRGFVRIYDKPGYPPVQDIIYVAEYPYIFILPNSPSPASQTEDVTMPLFQWTAAPGAVTENIYFGTNPSPGQAEFKGQQKVKPGIASVYFYTDMLEPGAKYYWRVDSTDASGVVHTGEVWSFTVQPVKATVPVPAEGATFQPLDATLGWKVGQNLPTHDVYLGTDKALVAAGDASVFKGNVTDPTFVATGLAPETTYYWRVDEIDASNVKFVGDVWSFATTLKVCGKITREIYEGTGSGTAVSNLTGNAKYPLSPTRKDEVTSFRSPDLGISNYGGSMSAFLHVPVDGDYTFWIASDDSSDLYLGTTPGGATRIAYVSGYTSVDQWTKFASQTSAVQTLKAGVYFIQALWKEGSGGDHCSVAWQGPGIKQQVIGGNYCEPFVAYWARVPSPALGATSIHQITTTLSWVSGIKAKSHDIYFGDDPAAVAAANPYSLLYMGRVSADVTTFVPGPLEWNKTYYWRVDEVNPAEPGNPWTGAVWNFKTMSYLVIDNTSYTVGYDNRESPFFSERVYDATANWTTTDWTSHGVNALYLEFQGVAVPPAATGSTTIDGPGAYTLKGAGTDVWNQYDQFQFAFMKLAGNGSIVAKVESVENKNVWAKGGVMIRQNASPASTYAMMALTGGGAGTGGGVNFQWRATAGASAAGGPNGPGVNAPYWVKLDRVGNVITAFSSPDGAAWTQLGDPQTIVMTETVLMGLYYTSHVDNKTFGTAKFTNVLPTGNIDPASAGNLDIGYGNSAQPIYVAVQDAAGKLAAATYPEPAATIFTSNNGTRLWYTWKVPLSDLAGLDWTNIAKVFVGIGDSLNPTADGIGVINVRNVRVLTPVVLPDSNVPIDITTPGDNVLGIPNTFNWPSAEFPANVIGNSNSKFLDFDGAKVPTGFSVQPSVGATVVTGLTFTSAGDAPERDPVKFELSGSNDSIKGPWTPIAAGDIIDFADPTTAWPRNTKGTTPITFPNTTAYKFYQVMFPACRGPNQNSMQIAEVELLGVLAQ